MEYVTIMEAARRCGVSDKTIQRAIRAGTLTAQYPQPNRCEIAVSDLETLKLGPSSGPVQTAVEERLATLESRVQYLEHLVKESLAKQKGAKSQYTVKARERTTGPLPKQFVSLLTFALYHNVSEATVQAHLDIGVLPVKRGEWIGTDGTKVILALDAKGRAAFSQLYHNLPLFIPCKQCPH